MAYKTVSETFSPVNEGGYTSDGTYYDSSNDYVTNSLFVSEADFEAFDASAINAYISSLASVSSVTLTSVLYNSDAFQKQNVGVAPLYYNNIGYQDTVLSDEGNDGAGDKNGAYNYQDVQDESGAQVGTVTNLSLSSGSTSTSVNVFSILEDAASAGRDLIVAYVNNGSNYGLTSVSSASITVTGVVAYDLPTIAGTRANQAVPAGGTFDPFSTVSLSDPGNISGNGDSLSIQVEYYGMADGYLGTLGFESGYQPSGTLQYIENGDYELTNETSIAGLQADLRHLAFTANGFEAIGGNDYDSFDLYLQSASGGGTEDNSTTFVITDPAACFLAGTAVAVPGGVKAIETLKVGDFVITADGAVHPVRWLGCQTVATRFADPLRSWPVRVKAGALGEKVPARDLLLSPDHALFLHGVLVQAGALVNGTSIVREGQVPERFTYYNLELAEHALILVEGAAAETFVDNIGRGVFDNAAEYAALYPDAPWIEEMALPRAKAARQVPQALRRRLADRAVAIGAAVAEAA